MTLSLRRYIRHVLLEQVDSEDFFDDLMGAAEHMMRSNHWLSDPSVDIDASGNPYIEFVIEHDSVTRKITRAFADIGYDYGYDVKDWGHHAEDGQRSHMVFMKPGSEGDCSIDDLGPYVFHVTPTSNKKSILANGLQPGDSGIIGYRGRIYLADTTQDFTDVLHDLKAEKRVDEFTILKIRTSDLEDYNLYTDTEWSPTGCSFVWTNEPIPPSAIVDTKDIRVGFTFMTSTIANLQKFGAE